VSTTTGTGGAHRASVTTSGGAVLFTWIVDGDVHIRLASPSQIAVGGFSTPDTALCRPDRACGRGVPGTARRAGSPSCSLT